MAIKEAFFRTRLGKGIKRRIIRRKVRRVAGNVAVNAIDFLQSPAGIALAGLAISELRRRLQQGGKLRKLDEVASRRIRGKVARRRSISAVKR